MCLSLKSSGCWTPSQVCSLKNWLLSTQPYYKYISSSMLVSCSLRHEMAPKAIINPLHGRAFMLKKRIESTALGSTVFGNGWTGAWKGPPRTSRCKTRQKSPSHPPPLPPRMCAGCVMEEMLNSSTENVASSDTISKDSAAKSGRLYSFLKHKMETCTRILLQGMIQFR